MTNRFIILRPRLLSASIAAIVGTTSTALLLPAYSQEARGPLDEEIVVTGSRIVQRDFTANSPIVSVEADMFEATGTLAVETVLNQLPQFVPEITQFSTGQIQPSATVTAGANTISLRGLGANRNLVLLDGRRPQPVNALLTVDTNTIPSSAIERVEVVTGGASATYGADAVSGVVNFILKKNFEGIDLDVQTSSSDQGDGGESRIAALFGANVDEGNGNVMIGLEVASREAALQVGREFYDRRLTDPTMTGTNTFLTSTYFSGASVTGVGPRNDPSAPTVASLFTRGVVPANGNFYLNRDGTVYADNPNGGYRYTDGTLDGTRKVMADGSIDENQPFSLVSTPLDRYSLFGRGRYGLSESLEVYAQGTFTQTETRTVQGWSPAIGVNWGATIPYGPGIYAPSLAANGTTTLPQYLAGGSVGVACPATGGCTNSQAFPVPAELAVLLNGRTNNAAPWQLNRVQDYLGIPRSTSNKGQTFQLLTGMTGSIEGIDGSWDVYLSHGETDYAQQQTGFGDAINYRNLVQSANYGRGATVLAPGISAPNTTAGGTATCQTGLPIFGNFAISDDCYRAVTANMTDTMFVRQDVLEGTVQGHILDMPAGELRFAGGASYRENEIKYDIAHLNSFYNTSTRAIGQFPGKNAAGETDAKDVFGELAIPVLSDAGPISSLSFEVGARYSETQSDSSNTYKSLFSLEFKGPLRLRGGYQRANRAPNVGELFAPEDTVVQATGFNGDPCGTNSFAPWGANPAFNPNYLATRALCSELMGPAAATFYGTPQTGTFATVSVLQNGNEDLLAEEADTVTFGAVLSFEQVELTVDWYEIEIADLIGTVSYDTVYQQCVSPEFNPSGTAAGNPFCSTDWIQRDPETGNSQRVRSSYANLGYYKTSGVDLQVNWRKQLGDNGGMIGVNMLGTVLDEYLTQDLPSSPVLDAVGTGDRGGQFDYRLFTTVNYSLGRFNTSLRMRYYPSIKHASASANPNTTTLGADSYDIFDLSGRFAFTEKYDVRFGIDNLLDTEPNIYGATPTTTGAGLTLNQFYDVLGRRYYVGFRARF